MNIFGKKGKNITPEMVDQGKEFEKEKGEVEEIKVGKEESSKKVNDDIKVSVEQAFANMPEWARDAEIFKVLVAILEEARK